MVVQKLKRGRSWPEKPPWAREKTITHLDLKIPKVVVIPNPEIDTAPIMMKEQRKGYKVPVLEIEKLLPVFKKITYKNVLDTMIEAGTILSSNITNLDPSTTFGSIANNTFKITMYLLEQELRKQVEMEQAKFSPLTKEKLFSRLHDLTKDRITRI